MGYICINIAKDIDAPETLECLSPLVMKWSDTVWIFDLRASMPFWKQQYPDANTRFKVWKHMVHQLFGSDVLDAKHPKLTALEGHVTHENHEYSSQSPSKHENGKRLPPYAVYGENVFQCVLLLHALQSIQPVGLISLSSKFAQHFYASITWEMWWSVVEDVSNYWQTLKIKGFQPPVFKRHVSRLKLALPKLGFKTPLDACLLPPAGFQKRYGKWLRLLLDWTIPYPLPHSSPIYVDGLLAHFPWKPWVSKPKHRVVRYLPFAMNAWHSIEPCLIQDLDACILPQAAIRDERVLLFSWLLRLENKQELMVWVRFKYPLALYQQRGTQDTALIHFRAAFDALDVPCEDIRVVDWELCIEESMCIPAVQTHLWGRESGQDDAFLIQYIDHNVPVAINQYDHYTDWCHTDSYRTVNRASNHHLKADSWSLFSGHRHDLSASLIQLAKQRPLFLYKTPQLHEVPIRKVLLEQTMTKWWESEESSALAYVSSDQSCLKHSYSVQPDSIQAYSGRTSLTHASLEGASMHASLERTSLERAFLDQTSCDQQFFRWKRHGRWEWGSFSHTMSKAITYGVFS